MLRLPEVEVKLLTCVLKSNMAATTNGGWAVVGAKKGKPQTGTAAAKAPQSKAAKKKTAESMPKIIPMRRWLLPMLFCSAVASLTRGRC